MADSVHIYNLKAVMKEVGISAATLRAWERRYHLPEPQRSAGGHRLYSRQDIEMLKWLVARQDEGLSISHAIEMWKAQQSTRQELAGQVLAPMESMSMGEAMLDELREQWVTACSAFDDQSANHILDQAFALAAPEVICSEVLQKGLAQVGDGWYSGTVSVQQEHFATAIAIRRINSLLAAVTAPTRRECILVACPPGEEHSFVLLMLTYLLRRRGWNVVHLGADVPLKDLDATIQQTRPAMVLSAAQSLDGAASLRLMSEYLQTQGVPLAFGGGIFLQVPAAARQISGYYLGRELSNVPKLVEILVIAPPDMPTATPISPEYAATLQQFLHHEMSIGDYVTTSLRDAPLETAHVEIAIESLGRLISSALSLGDINLLDPSIAWLDELLKNRGISPAVAGQFYAIYNEALKKYLGDDGAIIQDWLSKLDLTGAL